jgi:hypothetical protein
VEELVVSADDEGEHDAILLHYVERVLQDVGLNAEHQQIPDTSSTSDSDNLPTDLSLNDMLELLKFEKVLTTQQDQFNSLADHFVYITSVS